MLSLCSSSTLIYVIGCSQCALTNALDKKSLVAGIPEPTARLHTYVDVMPKIKGMVSRR
jgi:hypothetical protein